YFYPWLCCWCGNLQNNHKGLNPQNGNSPLLFQLKKFHRTAIIIKMFVKRFISILQKWGQPILELPPNIIFRIYRIFNPLT
nr:hypothetical protein [Prevotella sp.]